MNLLRPVASLLLLPLALAGSVLGGDREDPLPGLVASFTDGKHSISRIVAVPELGLAPDESPHPGIAPAFTATYEGLLTVSLPGRYQFAGPFTISLDGEPVSGEVELAAGQHALRLSYRRSPGPVSAGLSWQSQHFVREPVPPGVLFHEKAAIPRAKLAGDHPSPPHRIARTMTAMKCASCHDRNFLATMHRKFAPDALLPHIRHVNPMKWYGAMTGPRFDKNDALIQLVADLKKLPGPERRREDVPARPGKGLDMVGTKTGLACIACHDVRHHRTAAESKGPNLAYITDRVSYDWFVRWMTDPQRLQPGVPMPTYFAGQEPAERRANIDALWDYLLLGEKMPLPEELKIDPRQFILQPKGRPLVNRVYIRLPDKRELLRAICVGLPNGMSYCFDAETCQLVYVWTGGYLDMAPHWKNQSGFPTPPVGETYHLADRSEGLRIGSHEPVYRGYELVDGIPRFEWDCGGRGVRMRVDSPAPGRLRQVYEVAAGSEPITYSGPGERAAVSVRASTGTWSGDLLTIESREAVRLELTYTKEDDR